MELRSSRIASFDGTELAVHRMGEGMPVLLWHGLFSSAEVNWIKFGHAAMLAEAGFEAIMPDWRAHGHSDAPRDPAAYPHDVLVKDALALTEALGLADYDLVGFSLGARTALAAVIAGLKPRRLVVAGMGYEGLFDWERRAAFFLDMLARFDEIERGDRAWFARSFFKTMEMDREASRLLLEAVDDIAPEELARVTMPSMVLCGSQDRDNGSPEKLAEALPQARFVEIPGDHMSSVTKPAMGRAIVEFLAEE